MFTSNLTKAFYVLLYAIFDGPYKFDYAEIVFICLLFYQTQKNILLDGADNERKVYLGPFDFEIIGIERSAFYKAAKSLERRGYIRINQDSASPNYKYYSFDFNGVFSIGDLPPILKLFKGNK